MKFLSAALSSSLILWSTTVAQPFDETSNDGLCVDCMEYEALNAQEKIERIWSKINSTEYSVLPQDWLGLQEDFVSLADNGNDYLNSVFDRVSDERPTNLPRLNHLHGSVARVEWQPSAAGHNFTGIFEEENREGILRISHCAPLFGGRVGVRPPYAFALKFMRSGIHSANWITCEANSDQRREDFNYATFRHPLHTMSPFTLNVKAVLVDASDYPGVISVDDTAAFREDGSVIQDPNSPAALHFFPNTDLNTKDTYNEDFRLDLPDVPVGSKLYTAYTTVDGDGNPNICTCKETEDGALPCLTLGELTNNCNLIELGSIVSTSRFTHSDYGDNGLWYNHGRRPCDQSQQRCDYELPIDFVNSITSEPNSTCISSFTGSDCRVLDDNELTNIDTEGCVPEGNSPNTACPFAQRLHDIFTANDGPAYPIELHRDFCDVQGQRLDNLVSRSCCIALNGFAKGQLDDLRQICVLDDGECAGVFESKFVDNTSDQSVEEMCGQFAAVEPCTIGIFAGGATRNVPVGEVSQACCAAGNVYLNSLAAPQVAVEGRSAVNSDLEQICQDPLCTTTLGPIYAIGISFIASSGFEAPTSLEAICSEIEQQTEPIEVDSGDQRTPSPTIKERMDSMDDIASSESEDDASGTPSKLRYLSVYTLATIVAFALFA